MSALRTPIVVAGAGPAGPFGGVTVTAGSFRASHGPRSYEAPNSIPGRTAQRAARTSDGRLRDSEEKSHAFG